MEKVSIFRYYGSKLKSKIKIFIFNLNKFYRYFNKKIKNYNKINDFKGVYKDKRCFIIGTGPSLNVQDLNLLKNEITFGVNALCKVFSEIGWETTFYGIQDDRAFKTLEKDILEIKESNIIISDYILKKNKIKNLEKYIIFPLNFLNHNTYHNNYTSKFSDDIYKVVYDGYSIVYSLIQIAVYMGFTEIYLLGVDCNYDLEKYYSINHNIKQENPKMAGYKMIQALKIAKIYENKLNFKIYNATRGGKLDIFERVKLEEVLR